MKRLLCVVDLTESAAKVLDVAATIANACNAHMVVLFPYRLMDYGVHGDLTSLRRKIETEAREKFNALKTTVPTLESTSCEFRPEIGFVFDRIISSVRNNEIEMIILGQQQIRAINDRQGLTLENLMSTSMRPFVIVPEAKTAEPVH
jgi:hypothetical protein